MRQTSSRYRQRDLLTFDVLRLTSLTKDFDTGISRHLNFVPDYCIYNYRHKYTIDFLI